MHAGTWVRQALSDHHVLLEGTLLKPNMVCAGLLPPRKHVLWLWQVAVCISLCTVMCSTFKQQSMFLWRAMVGAGLGLPSCSASSTFTSAEYACLVSLCSG